MVVDVVPPLLALGVDHCMILAVLTALQTKKPVVLSDDVVASLANCATTQLAVVIRRRVALCHLGSLRFFVLPRRVDEFVWDLMRFMPRRSCPAYSTALSGGPCCPPRASEVAESCPAVSADHETPR